MTAPGKINRLIAIKAWIFQAFLFLGSAAS